MLDPIDECLSTQLYRLRKEVQRLDTIVQHVPRFPDEHKFLPYVGNGYIGTVIVEESTIHIKVKVFFLYIHKEFRKVLISDLYVVEWTSAVFASTVSSNRPSFYL